MSQQLQYKLNWHCYIHKKIEQHEVSYSTIAVC